jgi:rhodanese-related sulfurtransferase
MSLKYIFTGILFALVVLQANAQQVTQINSKEVQTKIAKEKNWVILDVRTAEEFNTGHIKGAINIDIRQPNAFSEIDKLNHKAKYIVHCRTNHRSKIAVDHMVENGFKTVYQMTDGFSGWISNNLEIQK